MSNDFRELRPGGLRDLEDFRLIHPNSLDLNGLEVFLRNRRRREDDILTHPVNPLREHGLTPHPDEPTEFIKPFDIKNFKLRSVGIRVFDVTIITDQPILLGEYCFWQTKGNSTVFVCRQIPQIHDFQLVLHKEVVGSTIKITGGSLSYVAKIGVTETDIREQESTWRTGLKELGKNATYFEPLDSYGEEHDLDLPKDIVQSSNSIFQFVQVMLSESGAVTWKKMLENKQGELLPGVHHVTINYRNGYIEIMEEGRALPRIPSFGRENTYKFNLPVSKFLGQFGPEVISLTDPKIENETHVIISGDPVVNHVIVTLIASNGLSMSQTFTSEGGKLSHKWTTDQMQTLEVTWEALIKYIPKGWPEVKESGKLSARENNLIAMIKPEAWIRKHALTVLLVDDQGNPLSTDTAHLYQVYAEFIFKAPFLEGDGIMSNTYQMEPQKTLDLSFPKPPSESPGVLELRVSAFGNNSKNLQICTLNEDEIMVIAKIFPDAKITVETNKTGPIDPM